MTARIRRSEATRKGTRAAGPSWVRALLAATLLVGAGIAGLVAARSAGPGGDATAQGSQREARGEAQGKSLGDASAGAARSAVPAEAWAVLELDLGRLGDLASQLRRLPEALGSLDCDQVASPPRVALGLLAPGSGDDLEFVLAAADVTPGFLTCARQRMLDAGGDAAPEVQSWPSGVESVSRSGGLRLLLDQERARLLFAVAPTFTTADLVALLAGRRPNAAREGRHATLRAEHAPTSALTLTVAPPDGWLERLVPPEEAERSPLRYLRASSWALQPDALRAFIDCAPSPDDAGCHALARFVTAARDDLLTALAAEATPELTRGWSLTHEGPTRLVLRWQLPPDVSARLLETALALRL